MYLNIFRKIHYVWKIIIEIILEGFKSQQKIFFELQQKNKLDLVENYRCCENNIYSHLRVDFVFNP